MKIWDKIKGIAKKKKNDKTAPLLIIQKKTDGTETKEYDSIEKAILDFENDNNISTEKLKELKKSLEKLKHKNSIRIKNGEIVD